MASDLPRVAIHHARLGNGFLIEGRHPDPNYVLLLPLSGYIEATACRSSTVCDPRRALILCRPTAPAATLRSEAAVTALVLRLSQAAMARQLAALLGEPAGALPEFALTMDLAAGYGQGFARYLLLAVTDFKRARSPWNSIMVSEFEDFIISKLLMSHPHNFATALQRADRPLAPRNVKRAIDYIQAKLASPINIADIAEASGIAGRTLFKHFQNYHGISPMRYLRNARFDRAREALQRAQPDDSVTELAMRWGFSHLGRFSIEYRKRFGEHPSDTLRRRR
jgi:AraC-like DNA-binding protein